VSFIALYFDKDQHGERSTVLFPVFIIYQFAEFLHLNRAMNETGEPYTFLILRLITNNFKI
jgi:hypothetical protein